VHEMPFSRPPKSSWGQSFWEGGTELIDRADNKTGSFQFDPKFVRKMKIRRWRELQSKHELLIFTILPDSANRTAVDQQFGIDDLEVSVLVSESVGGMKMDGWTLVAQDFADKFYYMVQGQSFDSVIDQTS
jgi:hypothetical protein